MRRSWDRAVSGRFQSYHSSIHASYLCDWFFSPAPVGLVPIATNVPDPLKMTNLKIDLCIRFYTTLKTERDPLNMQLLLSTFSAFTFLPPHTTTYCFSSHVTTAVCLSLTLIDASPVTSLVGTSLALLEDMAADECARLPEKPTDPPRTLSTGSNNSNIARRTGEAVSSKRERFGRFCCCHWIIILCYSRLPVFATYNDSAFSEMNEYIQCHTWTIHQNDSHLFTSSERCLRQS